MLWLILPAYFIIGILVTVLVDDYYPGYGWDDWIAHILVWPWIVLEKMGIIK